MSVRIFLIWLWMISTAFGQGFAGLDGKADGFSVPVAGKPLVFPDDHGPHAAYRIEWWYVTANLHGADGADYGVQWTLFRTGLAPSGGSGWSTPQLWMGHAALTTATQHFVAERLARGGIGQSGVTVTPFSAWIDNWQLVGTASVDAISNLDMSASGQDFSYALKLNAKGPVVLVLVGLLGMIFTNQTKTGKGRGRRVEPAMKPWMRTCFRVVRSSQYIHFFEAQ